MPKDELPPIEYDREVERYDFLDPRAFWERSPGRNQRRNSRRSGKKTMARRNDPARPQRIHQAPDCRLDPTFEGIYTPTMKVSDATRTR